MKKKFDCIQMKRLGAAKVREQTATLTREQDLRFWQERSQYLRQRQASLEGGEHIWADRPEAQDPVQFAEHLRRTIETRQDGESVTHRVTSGANRKDHARRATETDVRQETPGGHD